LIIYVSLDCLNLLSNYSDKHFGAVAGEDSYRFQKHLDFLFFFKKRMHERPQNPKNTNLTGGKGKGKGGRKTFIDDITSKSESAAQQSKLQKDSQPSYKAIFGTGEEVWSPETVQKPVGDIEDRVSVAGEQTEEEMDEFNK
jgi:hypothetical protein